MTQERYANFATIICGYEENKYGTKRSNGAFLNCLLLDLFAIINLNVVCCSHIPGNKAALGKLLARFTLLYIGKRSHSTPIIEEV